MSSPRESLARQCAREVLAELHIASAPIPVDDIVSEKGLLLERRDGFPSGVYGALFRKGNQFGVAISNACPGEGHRRFTVAHELGHFHVPDHIDRLFFGSSELAPSMGGHFRTRRDPLEVEADAFASELLMPDRFVRAVIPELPTGISAIQRLATSFVVSLSAAGIRYVDFASVPTMVLLSHNGAIEWTAISPSLWSHRWARRTWKGEWAPRGSGTRRLALSRERLLNGEEDGSALLLCEWLEGAPVDVEATEEAIGLGKYGRILTVISASELREPEDYDEASEHAQNHDWRDALRGYRLD